MATKPKTLKTPVPDSTLAGRFSAAIALSDAGGAEAWKALEAVAREAAAEGNVALARAARNYLLAEEHRRQAEVGIEAAGPELTASQRINLRDWQGALAVLDAALAREPERAPLHYLRAIALVLGENPGAAAESLRKAMALDRSMLFLYQMEPDFNPVRRNSLFVEFETA
jgi:hypothetical protein